MATNLARLEMEKTKNIGYGAATIPPYQMYNYDITRTVSIFLTSGLEGWKKVQVDVKKTGSATNIISLITYLENNVGYGP
jgi:hypothetical protein